MKVYHEILIGGGDFDLAVSRLQHFFALSQLVRYDVVQVIKERSLVAADPLFWERIELGEARNRTILEGLISELGKENFVTLADLRNIPPGYSSKMLHTIAHVIDGFFGIDSFLYNMEEDSHWVSQPCRGRISSTPSSYWLLAMEAEFSGKGADPAGIVSHTP